MLGVALASCSDNNYEYEAPTAETGVQAFFPNTLSSQIELSTAQNSFQIPVRRSSVGQATTVPLTFEADDDNICTVPTSVTFNAGDSVAYLKVTYDPAKIQYGSYAGGTITISDQSMTTMYGSSTYTFAAGVTAWVDMDGLATYREDLVTGLYGVDNVTYTVDIQKSVIKDGLYRLVNPYGAAYPYNADGDWDTSKDYYMEIDATDPDFVYVGDYYSEMAWGEGQFHFISFVQYFLNKGNSLDAIKQAHPEYFGTLQNGVITMPAESMLMGLANYNNGGLYKTNPNGLFAVALPGYKIADFSVATEYAGRFTDPTNNDFADLNVTLGADIATAKVALVSSSTWNADANAVVSGIESDSIASTSISGSGTARVAYDGTDSYVVVVVYYDAEGNVQGYYASDPMKLTSSKDSIEQFNDVYGGTLGLCAADLSGTFSSSGAWGVLLKSETYPITQEAVIAQSAKDPTHFQLSPFLQDGLPLDFHYDSATGLITVDQVDVYKGSNDAFQATDIVTWYKAIRDVDLTGKGFDSYFDSKTNIFHFKLVYHLAGFADYYAIEEETFEVTAQAAKAFRAAAAKTETHQVRATKHQLSTRTMKNVKNLMVR